MVVQIQLLVSSEYSGYNTGVWTGSQLLQRKVPGRAIRAGGQEYKIKIPAKKSIICSFGETTLRKGDGGYG